MALTINVKRSSLCSPASMRSLKSSENEPSVSSYPVPRSTLGTEDGDVGGGSGPRLGSVQGDDWEHASPAVVSEVLQATHPAEEKEGCRCRAAR